MTGFANGEGALAPWRWTADLRSVNGRGLDVRLRLPDWITGLEQAVRGRIAAKASRGNVTLNLRVQREDATTGLALNAGQLSAALTALKEIEAQALAEGLDIAPPRAADIAQMKGVMEQAQGEDEDTEPLKAAILETLDTMLVSFDEMRTGEGQALDEVLRGQLDDIARLTEAAAGLAPARKAQMQAQLNEGLSRVMEGAAGADPDRVAQELALILVKADVTEELDRLRAHVDAARELLDNGGVVGRKLDFLMQEFNREANTLCSKSQHTDLTRVGLDLKAVIDQMREQVQNVE